MRIRGLTQDIAAKNRPGLNIIFFEEYHKVKARKWRSILYRKRKRKPVRKTLGRLYRDAEIAIPCCEHTGKHLKVFLPSFLSRRVFPASAILIFLCMNNESSCFPEETSFPSFAATFLSLLNSFFMTLNFTSVSICIIWLTQN